MSQGVASADHKGKRTTKGAQENECPDFKKAATDNVRDCARKVAHLELWYETPPESLF
jgi:hypothetical protein